MVDTTYKCAYNNRMGGVAVALDPEEAQGILVSATNANANSANETIFDITGHGTAVFYLNVTAASGTNATLDVTVYEVAPDGKEYSLVTFTQATAVTSERKAVSGPLGYLIKVKYTIGGTTPSFTFAVSMVAK